MDWDLSQDREVDFEGFEKCVQLMSGNVTQLFEINICDFLTDECREAGLPPRALRGHGVGTQGYVMLDKDSLRSVYCEALPHYINSLWRLPIFYEDLTSNPLDRRR